MRKVSPNTIPSFESVPVVAPPLAPFQPEQIQKKELVNIYWDKTRIHIVERISNRVMIRQESAEHVSFVHRNNLPDDIERKLRSSERVISMNPAGQYTRIRWKDRWSCIEAASKGGPFDRSGVVFLEADVDPVRRYITERGVSIARPRRVYLDIEADSRESGEDKRKARMLAWALYNEQGLKVGSSVLNEDTDKGEKALLIELWTKLDEFDQVAAWAGDYYDFPYLNARTSRHRLRYNEQRWLWIDHLEWFRRANMNASESGDEKQSMKLDSIAMKIVGEGKSELKGNEAQALLAYLGLNGPELHDKYAQMFERNGVIDIGGADSWYLWAAGGMARELLLRYCERDTWLCYAIEQKTGYLELLLTLCQSCLTFPDTKGSKPGQQVEGFLLRLGHERGHRFPTHYRQDDEGQYAGAFVMEPKRTGIVRNVHVCDFARLYPSVILSFNLSPETTRGRIPKPSPRPAYMAHLRQEPQYPTGHALVPITNVIVAQEPRGILPIALEEMLRLRKEWDNKKASFPPGTLEWKNADRRSQAYKIAANSFYGVCGSPSARFFQRDTAESTSQAGVWLIKETIQAATKTGFEVIGCDTDSALVIGCNDEEFKSFVERCNDNLYPRLLKEQGATRNAVSLAYEKKFAIAVIVGKKRYAARYAHFKGTPASRDSKIEVKGLEYKRGDTVSLARELQFEVIAKLLRDEIDNPTLFVPVIDKYKTRILEGELALTDIVLSKRLAKPLGQYVRKTKRDGTDAAQAAHVEVAHVLRDRGRDIQKGVKIEYVIVDGGVNPAIAIPAEDFKGEFDRYYLWEHQVYPPTMRVLQAAFPEFDWSPWEQVRPRTIGSLVQTLLDFTIGPLGSKCALAP